MRFLFPVLVFYISVICTIPAAAQPTATALIDARARTIRGGTDLVALTDTLTAGYATDWEKTRAIFAWITAHIDYDCAEQNARVPEIDSAGERLLDTHYRLLVILKYRRALCGGYAFLFKTMCDLAGVEARVVEGRAHSNEGHAWNAVRIDGRWWWLDVTWASGGCDGRRFQREFREAYFLAPPEAFSASHRPRDGFWE